MIYITDGFWCESCDAAEGVKIIVAGQLDRWSGKILSLCPACLKELREKLEQANV